MEAVGGASELKTFKETKSKRIGEAICDEKCKPETNVHSKWLDEHAKHILATTQ